jgi:hypothetical protein
MVQFQRRVGFKIVFEARREQGNSHIGMLLLSSAAQVEGGCVSTVVTLVAEVWYDSMCQERIGVDQG